MLHPREDMVLRPVLRVPRRMVVILLARMLLPNVQRLLPRAPRMPLRAIRQRQNMADALLADRVLAAVIQPQPHVRLTVQLMVVPAALAPCLRHTVRYDLLLISIIPYITIMCICIPYFGIPYRSMFTTGRVSGATATAIGTTML